MGRRLDDRLREWLNSPQERELRERARRLGIKVDLSRPPSRKRRRKGAGHPRSLTPEQVERGKKLFRRDLKKDKTLKKQAAACAHLRSRLKLDVSDSTLLRLIIRPVRSE